MHMVTRPNLATETLQLIKCFDNENCSRGSDGVAQGDSATIWIRDAGRKIEFLRNRAGLRRESFVGLYGFQVAD